MYTNMYIYKYRYFYLQNICISHDINGLNVPCMQHLKDIVNYFLGIENCWIDTCLNRPR